MEKESAAKLEKKEHAERRYLIQLFIAQYMKCLNCGMFGNPVLLLLNARQKSNSISAFSFVFSVTLRFKEESD